MTEEEQRRVSRDKLLVFLEHAKQRVISNLRELYGLPPEERPGSLVPGLQAAVRLLGAKQRAIHRQYLSMYGEVEVDRAAAKLELDFGNDDGTLFQIRNWKHSRGRIDCPACYVEQLDNGVKRFIKICPHCEKGFQHCSTMLWNNREKQAIAYTGLSYQQAAMYQETGSFCLLRKCEVCGVEDVEPI